MISTFFVYRPVFGIGQTGLRNHLEIDTGNVTSDTTCRVILKVIGVKYDYQKLSNAKNKFPYTHKIDNRIMIRLPKFNQAVYARKNTQFLLVTLISRYVKDLIYS